MTTPPQPPPPGPYGPPPGGQFPPPQGVPVGGPPPGGGYPGQPGPQGQPGGMPQGQQPGFGQPYPQMGQPMGAPPVPPAPPEPKKSTFAKVRTIIVAVVVLGGLAFGAYWGIFKSADGAAVGDCIMVTKAKANDAAAERIDCNDARAVFKVAKNLDNGSDKCPEGDYDEYYQSGSKGFKLCLMLNAKDGECLKDLSSSDKTQKTPCGPDAEVKIVQVINGKADKNACSDEAQEALTYSDPATTFCLAQP